MIVMLSCNSGGNNKLSNDLLIKKHFSKKEVKDLESILYYFDNLVMNGCDNNLLQCYHSYLSTFKNDKEGEIDFKISSEEQNEVLSSIKETTFDKIWYYSLSFKDNYKDTTKVLMLKSTSSYMDFIKDAGKKNTHINKYYKLFMSSEDLSASVISYIINNYDKFNLMDEKERLILAIHYMTISERYK